MYRVPDVLRRPMRRFADGCVKLWAVRELGIVHFFPRFILLSPNNNSSVKLRKPVLEAVAYLNRHAQEENHFAMINVLTSSLIGSTVVPATTRYGSYLPV